MNRSRLVENIKNNIDYLTKNDVDECVDEIINLISITLCQSSRVEVRGFGTFSSRFRKERMARNPKTGSAIRIQKKVHPHFKAAKALKLNLKGLN